jgi:hypothetical protein
MSDFLDEALEIENPELEAASQEVVEGVVKKEDTARIEKVLVYKTKRFQQEDKVYMKKELVTLELTGQTAMDPDTQDIRGVFRVRRGKRIYYALGNIHDAPVVAEDKPNLVPGKI